MSTWFITGTSSGFGRRLAERLVARGDRVAATARDPRTLAHLVSAAPDQVWTAGLDITRSRQVVEVVDAAFAHFGRIDFIVNNAGLGLFGAVEEATRAQIQQVLDVDLFGSIDVIRAALPHLRAQGSGRIVQVSSAGGQVAYPGYGYYHAAKWGIEAVCESLAAEVAPFGIGVTIVEPGATPTGFADAKSVADSLPAYDTGDFGQFRRAVTSGSFRGPNDPDAIAAALIEGVQGDAPLRLPLGIDTYRDLHHAYTSRLALLEAQRGTAEAVARVDD